MFTLRCCFVAACLLVAPVFAIEYDQSAAAQYERTQWEAQQANAAVSGKTEDVHNKLCPSFIAPTNFYFVSLGGKQGCCLADKVLVSMQLAWDVLGCTVDEIVDYDEDGTGGPNMGEDSAAKLEEHMFDKQMAGFLMQNKPDFCDIEGMLHQLDQKSFNQCCNIFKYGVCHKAVQPAIEALKAARGVLVKCLVRQKIQQNTARVVCKDAIPHIYRAVFELMKLARKTYTMYADEDDITDGSDEITRVCDPEDFKSCPTKILQYFDRELSINKCEKKSYPNLR
jgi:hypothetical protein